MRNNLIGMCSAVAAVAVAGSSNADVALFNFNTQVTSSATGSFSGSSPFNQWDTLSSWKSTTTSATSLGGALTIATAPNFTTSGSAPVGAFSVSRATGSVDLSGTTAIEFNVTAYSGAATTWNVFLVSDGRQITIYDFSVSGSGLKSFSVSGLDPLFDWTKVSYIGLEALTQGIGTGRLPSSFTFDSMVAVGAVPAPGAIALLGAAGLMGRRRRN